jgi:hypothetical protein
MKFLLKDSSGKPSVTMTAFVLGFLVINLKLILSGMTIYGITLNPFTGGEYAAAIASIGSIYVLRRNFSNTKKDGE